jgi:hypothetical protein
MEAQIFQHVMPTETIACRQFLIQLALANQNVTASLDEVTEGVGSAGPICQHAVQRHQDEAPAQCRKKGSRAVDGARQHRGEDKPQHGVESCLL